MAAQQIQVRVKVDADKATDAFRDVRRNTRRRTGEAVERAGKRVVLPSARLLAPSFVKGALVVRKSGTDAVVTTRLRGTMARVAGLLHWGGTVRTIIQPKRAKALLVNGQPVAQVNAPRRYTGKFFLTKAVEANRGRIEREVLEEILAEFSEQGLETS